MADQGEAVETMLQEGPALTSLLGQSSRPISLAPPMIPYSMRRCAGPLAEELAVMLTVKNGFYGFGTALHVFPACETADGYSLSEWNEPSLWKAEYGDILTDALCFAEDIFAEQFVIKSGAIHRFDPETADLTFMAESLDAWAQMVQADDGAEAGYGFAQQWKAAHGAPPPLGRRLAPKIPFVVGGDYAVSNLFVCDSVERLRFGADLAQQIRDLPDGAQIEFVIVP